jgi:hypothetical protein
MTDPSPTHSFVAAFFATVRGRLITALSIIVLLLGIATEVVSFMTGYYNMTKVRAEAEALTSDPSVDFAPGGRFYKPEAKDMRTPGIALDPETEKFNKWYEQQYADKHKKSVGK